MKENFITRFYRNEKSTFLFNLVASFALGILFSPFSNGLFFLLALSLLSELLCYIFTRGDEKYWNPLHKPFILLSYILGWYVGRLLSVPKGNILDDGIPTMEDIEIF